MCWLSVGVGRIYDRLIGFSCWNKRQLHILPFFFFFFKQKTAYEIGVRLVGSEMCIRDRPWNGTQNVLKMRRSQMLLWQRSRSHSPLLLSQRCSEHWQQSVSCLLYTSDAADEEDSVDLCGRSIIKQKKKKNNSLLLFAANHDHNRIHYTRTIDRETTNRILCPDP